MKKLMILVGPPGSGKSTFALDQCLDNSHMYVNQDLQGKEVHIKFFDECIRLGENIVVDRMNFSKEQRAKYLDKAKEQCYKTEIHVFCEPYNRCLENCLERENHPTIPKGDEDTARAALDMFFKKYERPTSNEAASIKFHYGRQNEFGKHKAIIVDLDGTLCNIEHRLHHMHGENKNWGAFLSECDQDFVNDWCRRIINGNSGSYTILCSGRPSDICRDKTETWLKDNSIAYDHLFMRAAGDYRRDDIVKEIILDFEILPLFEVLYAIDDRKQVVDMWRRRSITCLQCAEGNF